MRRPLLMMRTRGLSGPFFGKHVGNRASHPLAHSVGNFLSVGDETLGPELIINGSFDGAGEPWNSGSGWAIQNGQAEAFSGFLSNITQAWTPAESRTFRVKFTILEVTEAGFVNFVFYNPTDSGTLQNAAGTYSEDIKISGGTTFGITKDATFAGVIDNVSVREVLPTLGPELIVNGDFSSGTAPWSFDTGWTWPGGGQNVAHSAGTQANAAVLQTIPLIAGNTYRVAFTTLNGTYAGFGVSAVVGDDAAPTSNYIISDGDHEMYVVADVNTSLFRIVNIAVGSFVGDVTNVSCKEALYPPSSPELIINGGFESDSIWFKEAGWTIAGGFGVGAAGTASGISQNILESGKWYRTTWTVSTLTAGKIQLRLGITLGPLHSGPGTFTEDVFCDDSSLFYVLKDIDFVGTIDNISCKERLEVPAAQQVEYEGNQVTYLGEDVTYG